MAASDAIKDAIVHYFDCTGITGTKPADWKRRDKRTLATGETFRMYENSKLSRTVYTIGDEDDASILEADTIIYGMSPAEDPDPLMGNYIVSFETADRFQRTGYLYDQHQEYILRALFSLPGNINEDSENMFSYPAAAYSDLTIHMALKKLGFKFSRELSDWLSNQTRPTVGTPVAPVNPPQPYFLNPNYSAGLQPASNPAPAPAPTSKSVRFANKNPGQVAAAAAATHATQHQAMMNQIGQMAAQLGATGGVQIGSTHIPAAPMMRPLTGMPTLPPSGMFGSPGMAAAMPLMAAQHPELVNLQPAVQAAFITQRAQGLQGLDQINPAWDDDAAINRQFQSGIDEIEIERSHAIWLLYEIYDDGSSNPLLDFFTHTDEELIEELMGVLDLDEDDQYVSIRDDDQAYPAPFDLPVPQPPLVAPPPPPAPRTPMVGPASMNARAGSFAPLAVAPAAVAPPAPPPGNASAYVNSDSGDKWADFCGEVWGFYEVNKANLPLDLNWSDRYRPREAQITGLGYEFERTEYTGIRVRMGYLGRDGELLDNIDIPAEQLGELLKEWGGEWNIDDVTQMIHKRKGINPDTDFNYSAEELWPEVKAYLDAQGWKEAK